MTDDVKFGELLGKFRQRCGWSQEELAKKIGVSRNAIVLWEGTGRGRQTNTHPQSRGVVLQLADELLLSKEERKSFLEAAGLSIEHWPAEYWNVPYQHNPYFVGRETLLQSLRQRLIPGEKATALTQSISGLGGIGKTQLAVEYAHRYGEQYEAVFWIQADSQEVATAGLLRLATETLGLPEQQVAEQQIEAVKRWLQKRYNWLLIFDNAEDPQAILSTLVPSKHRGSVLITTRRRDAGVLAHNEVLLLLSEDEATLFLLRRAGRIAKNASVTDAASSDFFFARDLCQLLDLLPLALDQAGAYIAENGGSLKNYIDLYHKYRPILLDRRSANTQQGSRRGNDHPNSVLMTFWLSWEQIQERQALAGKVLQFCSFLAPDRILESLVQAGISLSEAEKMVEELEMDEALGLLYRYSLIERTEQMLSLHRLVQEVMQDVLSEDERQYWMEKAVVVVNSVFPSGKYGTWQVCESLLPHALKCVEWTPTLKKKKFEGAQLLGATGYYLYERAQYSTSESLYQRVLAIYREQLVPDYPDMAQILNKLAMLYQAQGKYSQAETLYQRTLAICTQQLGATHLDTVSIFNNLAMLYHNQGKYSEAESLYQRALVLYEELLGVHPNTAQILNNLAMLYHNQGKYLEAELLLKRALAMREALLEATHPDTAQTLNNLAELYRAQKKYSEAEPLYQRALMIREQQLGATHPITAQSFNNLAVLYYHQGKYSEAEPLYQRALMIREQQLGAHSDTAQTLSNLAMLYQTQGKYLEAESLLKHALAIREELLGAHPDTAICLNNLAVLYQRQGKYSEAEPFSQRALDIAFASMEREHPLTEQFVTNHLMLLAHMHTNGNLEALLQMLALRNQNDNPE